MPKARDSKNPSSEWEISSVLKTLRQQSKADQPPTAQIFLDDSVKVDAKSFEALAQEILDAASTQSGNQKSATKIGKLHPLAKSFSVTAHPDIFNEIYKSPSVKSILPSQISDIYPKPTDSK